MGSNEQTDWVMNQSINQSTNASKMTLSSHSYHQSINDSKSNSLPLISSSNQSVSQSDSPSVTPVNYESVDPSVNQSINQSVSHSPLVVPIDIDDEPVFQYDYCSPSIAAWTRRSSVETEKDRKAYQHISQSINQLVSQQSINQPINQSIGQSISHSNPVDTGRKQSEADQDQLTSPFNTNQIINYQSISHSINNNQLINQSHNIYQSINQSINQSIPRFSRHTSVPSLSCEARCDWAASYSFESQSINHSLKSPVNINQSINQSLRSPINHSISQSLKSPLTFNRSISSPVSTQTLKNQSVNQSTINMDTFEIPSINRSINQPINQSINQSDEVDHSALVARLSSSLTLVHEAEIDDDCGIVMSCDQSINQSINPSIKPLVDSPKNLNKFGLKLSFTQPDNESVDELLKDSISVDSIHSLDHSINQSVNQSIKSTNSGRGRAMKRGSFDMSENGTLIAGAFQINQSGVRKSINQSSDEGQSIGTQINARDLIKIGELGTGATGTVLKSINLTNLQLVAVKTLSIYDTSQRHQMLKELHGFSLTNHPNLLHFHGACLDDVTGQCSLVLEWIDCGCLETMLAKYGPCRNEVQLAFLCRQMCLALEHLDSLKCIHRDLKPGNFLLQSNGCVKMSDFGLLRQLDRTKDLAATFLGTMSFLAPERMTGDSYSCASDIWSAGMSILTLMNGPAVNQSIDYWSLLSLVNAPAPRISVQEGWSEECVEFMEKCLQKDPQQRWSAKQLLTHKWLCKNQQIIESLNNQSVAQSQSVDQNQSINQSVHQNQSFNQSVDQGQSVNSTHDSNPSSINPSSINPSSINQSSINQSVSQSVHPSVLDGSLPGSWPISRVVKPASSDTLNLIARVLLDHKHPCIEQLEMLINQSINQVDQSVNHINESTNEHNQSINQLQQQFCTLCGQLRCTPNELKQAIELELQYRQASDQSINQSTNQSTNQSLNQSLNQSNEPKRASMTSSGHVNALSMSQQIQAMTKESMRQSLNTTVQVDLYADE